MKKRLLIAGLTSVICIVAALVLSRAIKLSAVSASEEFLINGTTLVKYNGDDSEVVIPSGIKTIGQAAFENNDSVNKVIFPDGLEKIEYGAFSGCKNIERIVLPDSVLEIDSSAFANCSNLSGAYIGNKLNKLEDSVFLGCPKLADIEVNSENLAITCLDGVIYSSDKSKLIEMLAGREKDFFVMPNSVKEICPYAFYGCDNLKHVIVSDGVTVIGPNAFTGATELNSVAVPFTLAEVGMNAFKDCKQLKQVYLPDKVTKIHDTAFDGCDYLRIYTTKQSAAEEFANKHNIDVIYEPIIDVNLAQTLRDEYAAKKAEERMQEAKEKANDIIQSEILASDEDENVIGKTIVVGGRAVFIMDGNKLKVYSGEPVTEDDASTSLNEDLDGGNVPDNYFYLQNDLTSITIPVGTTSIGKLSFARSGLESVDIPEGVVSIGYGAFYHCDNLKDVTIPSSVTSIDMHAFEHTPFLDDFMKNSKDDYLIVGDGVLLAYKCKDEDFKMPEGVKSLACSVPITQIGE